GRGVGELAQILLVAVERMPRDEEAERLALGAQLLLARPRAHRRERWWGRGTRPLGEESDLLREALLLAIRRPAHHVVETREESGPVALDRVEGPALDEALDHAPVHQLAPDAEAEVGEAGEGTLGARREDRFDRLRADALHRAEAEADRLAGGGEVLAARVHVGRQDGDAALAALGDVLVGAVDVARLEREQPGHELGRVSRLQAAGLV